MVNLNFLDLFLLFTSTCSVVLHVLSPILFSFWSCSLSSSPNATACRPASSSLFPGCIGTSPAPLSTRLFSFFHSLCLSDSLSLYASILALPVKVLDTHCCVVSSLFCATSALHNPDNLKCGLNVSRHYVEASRLNLWNSCNCNPQKWCDAPSLSDLIFFVNFNSRDAICHGVPHKPSQFVESHASFSGCLVQLLPHTTPLFGDT